MWKIQNVFKNVLRHKSLVEIFDLCSLNNSAPCIFLVSKQILMIYNGMSQCLKPVTMFYQKSVIYRNIKKLKSFKVFLNLLFPNTGYRDDFLVNIIRVIIT